MAEHGPEALSNAAIMDNVCRDHLIGLPGESILIGSAARSNVPALLRDLIPRLGNYGAIQSAAATLAGGTIWTRRRACGWSGSSPGPWAYRAGRNPAGSPHRSWRPGPGAGAGASAAGASPQSTPGAAARPPGPGVAAGTGAPPPTGAAAASRVFNRNTLGVAAAIALVAGYLGVAAVAHLSPFPARTVAATSSQSPGTGTSTSAKVRTDDRPPVRPPPPARPRTTRSC